MGKLRLKLQAMMPSVWYRRLKMELRMRAGGGSHQQGAINYKRWSSQRKQLGSSKKLLIKASPLPSSTLSPISASFSQLEERQSHPSPSLPEERGVEEIECLSHTSHTMAASIELVREIHFPAQRETQFAKPETHFANAATHFANLAPAALEQPPHDTETQIIEDKASETRESHPEALCFNTQLPPLMQAPSLSSPLPLSDKSFQLNLQELNSKLNALSYDQRRTYYSSPIFAVASPTPIFDKLDLDFMVKNSIEAHDESLVASKLFFGEDKLFTNEASRSSYICSTSLTGRSNTSSEDTALDKASSSSVWERDLSSLPSEGSELFPAMEKIRNTVAFLRRKSRKARKDASLKQRRRQKDARGKFPHALEEFGHFDGDTHSFDNLCQWKAQEKVPSIEKLKLALAGSRPFYALHSPIADEVHSMQLAQSETSFNTKGQDSDAFLRHRRSVSNESLFLETIGLNQAFNRRSPWPPEDAGFDKFCPSDSAFSDSELENCRSHRSNALQERYGSIDGHRRQTPKQSFYFDRDITNLSPLYNEAYSEFVLPAWRQHPSNLPHPSSSKRNSTYRSLHSSVSNGSKKSSNRESFDTSYCYSPSFKITRGGCGLAPSCGDRNHLKSLLSESNKSSLNMGSPSVRTGSCYDNQCKGCSRSFATWRASPETSNRSKVLKDTSTISSDNDDYDGDVSRRSYNEHGMESLGKSHRKLTDQLDGKEFSRSSSTLTTHTSVCQSWVPPISKSGSKRSTNDDYESLHGFISVPSWSKMYSKGEAGHGKESGIVASPSKSPAPLSTFNEDYGNEEWMSARSKEGEKEGNESIQSDSRVACAWERSPTSIREEDREGFTVSIASLIEREMGERLVPAIGTTMSKSGSRREQLNGLAETRVEVKGGKDKEGKEGNNERGGNKEGGVNAVREECVEKSKVYESFAMVKCSSNPSQDFKESMMEMVLHKKLHESLDLVELLQCYLSLNSPRYHDIIVKAFIDLWSDLFRPSI